MIKTLDIEIAVMRYFGVRSNLIVPNVWWGMGLNYECDLVRLTPSNYATEIEIKITKYDLLKDKKKKNYHNGSLFKELYFAVPEKLKDTALKEMPERSGLFIVVEKTYKV